MTLTDDELADLYARYAHVLFHRAMGILKNEELAHDAVQETFARVLQKSDEFRGQASPLTWMYRISTNYCLNQIRNRDNRARKREVHRSDFVSEESTSSHESQPDHTRLLDLLATVDDETRACVLHTFFDDCTRQETADLVGISVPTVRKRVRAFVELARDHFGTGFLLTAIVLLIWSVS